MAVITWRPTTFSDGELKSGHTLQSNQGADWTLTGVFIGCEHSGVFLCTCIIARSRDTAAVAYVITLSFAQIISVRCRLQGFSYALIAVVVFPCHSVHSSISCDLLKTLVLGLGGCRARSRD